MGVGGGPAGDQQAHMPNTSPTTRHSTASAARLREVGQRLERHPRDVAVDKGHAVAGHCRGGGAAAVTWHLQGCACTPLHVRQMAIRLAAGQGSPGSWQVALKASSHGSSL